VADLTSAVNTVAVSTPDGRRLAVETAGRAGGPAILVHSGTPNCRHLYAPWVRDAQERGAWLISYDRPGYGESTPHPGRRVADAAADSAAVAEALGIERFATWGLSGGGPHALACAALLPDRVSAAAAIGSIAPYGAPGLDFFSGMGQENVDDIHLMLNDPEGARRKTGEDREAMLAMSLEELRRADPTLVSAADAAVLAGPFGEHFHRCVQDGLAPGAEGWIEDGEAHLAPWGFALDEIRVPVRVWHGGQDQFVPFAHGQWLAAHIPRAQSSFSDADGHLTVVDRRIAEVHDWLLGSSHATTRRRVHAPAGDRPHAAGPTD